MVKNNCHNINSWRIENMNRGFLTFLHEYEDGKQLFLTDCGGTIEPTQGVRNLIFCQTYQFRNVTIVL